MLAATLTVIGNQLFTAYLAYRESNIQLSELHDRYAALQERLDPEAVQPALRNIVARLGQLLTEAERYPGSP